MILYVYFWLHQVFVALCRLSLIEVSGGYPSCSVPPSHCGGFSCCRAQALGHVGLSGYGSQALGHRFNSCGKWPAACGIFLRDQPHLLRWQGGFFITEPLFCVCGKIYSNIKFTILSVQF